MKKIFSVLLAFVMAFSCVSVALAADGEAETPTATEIVATYDWYSAEADTYVIDSVSDLAGMGKLTQGNVTVDGTTFAKTDFAGKTVQLGADITFADNEYWYYNDNGVVLNYEIKSFAGTFDGNEKTIKGLKFRNTSNSNPYMYLFETISGSIYDLTLDTVNADINYLDNFGFIAFTLKGTADNCKVNNAKVTVNTQGSDTKGYVTSSGLMFGTMTSATLKNSSVENSVITLTGTDNSDNFGALVGLVSGTEETRSTITNCSLNNVKFDCSRKTKRTGGLIGNATYVDVSDCTVTGLEYTILNYYQHFGGFVGQATTSSHFTDCTVISPVIHCCSEGYSGWAGGFAALCNGTDVSFIRCSVIELDMIAQEANDYRMGYVGGFIGEANGSSTFEECSVTGKIDASNVVADYFPMGGFAGVAGGGSADVEFKKCTADTDIVADNTAGGFIGVVQVGIELTVTDCEANGDVTSLNGVAGGFIGTVTPNTSSAADKTITITGCQANGSVVGATAAGGFVADLTTSQENDANATTVIITNSTASPLVVGTTSNSTVNNFAQETIPEGSTSKFTSEGNTASNDTIKIYDEGKTLVVENGKVTIPADSTILFDGDNIYVKEETVIEFPLEETIEVTISTEITEVFKYYDGTAIDLSLDDFTASPYRTLTEKWYADNNGTLGEELAAAPSEVGTYWYVVSAAGDRLYSEASVTVRCVIEMLHEKTVSYQWKDYNTCVATVTCTCGDVETVDLTVTSAFETVPTCERNGVKVYTAKGTSSTGESLESMTKEILIAPGHKFITVPAVEATCKNDGNNEYQFCTVCEYTLGKQVIPAKECVDENHDGKCDVCKEVMEKVASCGCICHSKDGFIRFIYQILLVLMKAFNIHRECICGMYHF